MKLPGVIGTAVLSLALGATAPAYAQQEQHDQQQEQRAKPDERAQPEKSAKQEERPAAKQEKSNQPEERNARQQENNTRPAEKNTQPQERAGNNRGGRIPDDRFKANFGREHSFRVSQSDYRNHRFQYSGYWFGFVDPWPNNWLYTQDVYVVEINGVYYLCNPMYPGVNLVLSFTL